MTYPLGFHTTWLQRTSSINRHQLRLLRFSQNQFEDDEAGSKQCPVPPTTPCHPFSLSTTPKQTPGTRHKPHRRTAPSQQTRSPVLSRCADSTHTHRGRPKPVPGMPQRRRRLSVDIAACRGRLAAQHTSPRSILREGGRSREGRGEGWTMGRSYGRHADLGFDEPSPSSESAIAGVLVPSVTGNADAMYVHYIPT